MGRSVRRRPAGQRWRLFTFVVGATLFFVLMTIPVYRNNYGRFNPPALPAEGEPQVVVLPLAETATPTATPSPLPSATPAPPATATDSPTATATEAATATPVATALADTPTPPPTATATAVPTIVDSPTGPATVDQAATPDETVVLLPTATPTAGSTQRATAAAASTVTVTSTLSLTATATMTTGDPLTPTARITASAAVSVALVLLPTATPTPPVTPTATERPEPTTTATATPAQTSTPTPTPGEVVVAAGANPQIGGQLVSGQLAYQEKHYIPLAGINPNLPLVVEMDVDPPFHPALGEALTVYLVSQTDWQEITSGGIHPLQAHREVGRPEGPAGRVRASISQPSPPYYLIVVNDSTEAASYTITLTNGSFGE